MQKSRCMAHGSSYGSLGKDKVCSPAQSPRMCRDTQGPWQTASSGIMQTAVIYSFSQLYNTPLCENTMTLRLLPVFLPTCKSWGWNCCVMDNLCGVATVRFTLSPFGLYLHLTTFIESTLSSRAHSPSSGHSNAETAPDLRRGVPEFTEETLSWVILHFCSLVRWGLKTEIKFSCRKMQVSFLHLCIYEMRFPTDTSKQNKKSQKIWGCGLNVGSVSLAFVS